MNIYNADLLNPEDIEVLPELHRFGYYMMLAVNAKENNENYLTDEEQHKIIIKAYDMFFEYRE